jgi:hypothetical protein
MERRTPADNDIKVTPVALDAFRRMHELNEQCTCKPRDWAGKYWKHEPCAACEQWWRQHEILSGELALPIWYFPVVERPDARSPYPKGSAADKDWRPDREAQERYKTLAKAAGIRI